jgi:hypothetical protein
VVHAILSQLYQLLKVLLQLRQDHFMIFLNNKVLIVLEAMVTKLAVVDG